MFVLEPNHYMTPSKEYYAHYLYPKGVEKIYLWIFSLGVKATNNSTYESTFFMKLFRKNFMLSNVISFQTIPVWYSFAGGRMLNQVGRPATCFPIAHSDCIQAHNYPITIEPCCTFYITTSTSFTLGYLKARAIILFVWKWINFQRNFTNALRVHYRHQKSSKIVYNQCMEITRFAYKEKFSPHLRLPTAALVFFNSWFLMKEEGW